MTLLFQEVIDVAEEGSDGYPESPQVDLLWFGLVSLINLSNSLIYFSFDGTNDHGVLTTTGVGKGAAYELPHNKVWLRVEDDPESAEVSVVVEGG